jgi:hypothetical protein
LVAVTALLRLLDLVRRELGAEDARAEIGGADPLDPRLLFARHPGGFRVVAVFNEAPEDSARLHGRLADLLESFSGVGPAIDAAELRLEAPRARRLDAALGALAERAKAACAFVVDRGSPMIWGSSGARDVADGVDAATRQADVLERHALAADVALARVRDAWSEEPGARLTLATRHGGFGVLARGFAGSYALVMAFDAPYSELHAEAALLHALPTIERLVLALPPIEPPDNPRKVVRLRPVR